MVVADRQCIDVHLRCCSCSCLHGKYTLVLIKLLVPLKTCCSCHTAVLQTAYGPTSVEYDTVVRILLADIDSWADQILKDVKRNAAVAADLQKVQAETEELLRQQRIKSDAALQEIWAEKQALIQQQQNQLAVITAQNHSGREESSMMASIFAGLMSQMAQMRTGCCSRGYASYEVINNLIKCPQTATVCEVGSIGDPSSRQVVVVVTVEGLASP